MRILIVEDEPRLVRFLVKGLRENSYAVDVASDGETALYQVSINDYDLIILDVMLPRKDGFEVCRALRQQKINVPVLMLTARDTVDDRVKGLDVGADDYLVKPFDFRELLARLRALLRRPEKVLPEILRVNDLSLNTVTHTATRTGKPINLTAREYALLEYFVRNAGTVLGRQQIAEHVWDENFDPYSNVIDVYVRRLRCKVDEGFSSPLIHTRRGEGYVLSATGEKAVVT